MKTDKEIEEEIQARIAFKMNEFATAVKNSLRFKYAQAFDMTRESQYMWKAFEEVSGMLNKEINMATPYDEMAVHKKWEAKEKAVEKITNIIRGITRGRHCKELNVPQIVNTIKPEYVYDTKGNGVTSHYDGYSFESYHGRINIEQVERGYIHSLDEEITEKEFNKAWN